MAGSEQLSGGPTQRARWNRVAERGSLWGLRFTIASYRLLGRRLTLPLVRIVVTYFFLTDAPGRRASLAYLKRVHATEAGRKTLGSSPPGLRHCFEHYRSFAVAIVDRLAIWIGNGEGYTYDSSGIERFDQLAEEQRGAIIVGAHLGNFDALRLLAKRMNRVVNVLMYTANAPLINSIISELSPDAEARVITADPNSVQAVFAVRECLRRGEHVAILGDRIEPGKKSRVTTVDMLGGNVQLPQAPVLLAAALGCPLMLMIALGDGPGHYRVFAEPLAESVKLPRAERESAVKELLEAYSSRLEYYCIRFPYQWFNFYDYWGELGATDEPR
jgi:predicted LPLAT superfamily acyltransferase